MKTALQELISWCDEFDNSLVKPTHVNMKEKIWQLLQKERSQITDSYIEGSKNGFSSRPPFLNADSYYNETFK